VDIDAERIGPGCILVAVSTDSAQLFFSLLMFVAAFGGISLVLLRVAASAGNRGAAQVGAAVGDAAPWLAFLVAATATLGSLYFSEVANFVPCRLCWFQRIAMYPLSVVLLVGAIRRDPAVRWYAGPLALIGGLVAGYHTLIEWRPELESGACEAFGPSCTDVWFREFGFVTLATMALVGFLTILLLLFVRFPATLDPATPDPHPADESAARVADPSPLEHIS
jgi:disulfide bond formation protein DsbB